MSSSDNHTKTGPAWKASNPPVSIFLLLLLFCEKPLKTKTSHSHCWCLVLQGKPINYILIHLNNTALLQTMKLSRLLVVSMSQTTRMVTELDLFYWPILLHTTYILSCIHIPITSLCSIHVIAQYITPCVHVNGIFHTINKMLVLMHWSKLL